MTSTEFSAAGISLADIAAVAARADPIQRNLGVTAMYHAFAVGLSPAANRTDLTWCAFATWASATAGRMIGMQEVPAAFRSELARSPEYNSALPAVHHLLDHGLILAAGQLVARQVSESMSAGNTLVFTELAPVFAGLLTDTPFTSDTEALAEAYERYRRAFADPDRVRTAQEILAANVAAVYHEQQRLQPYITAALDAGLRDAVHEITGHRLLGRGFTLIEPMLEPLLHAADQAWDRALTRHATTLITPTQVFDLGRDVPRLADGSLGPAALDTLTDPDAAATVARFDRTGGTLVGSAARDWGELADRMNYIVNLFRSRQQDQGLVQPLPG